MLDWSRIVLLYGPPGTGKTSLCQALAQQLSIRLSKAFPLCKLVEFDAYSMFSQYFGESGKFVNGIFAMIESMLDEDKSTLICVFIDEIESLAGKRQYSAARTSHKTPQGYGSRQCTHLYQLKADIISGCQCIADRA